MTIKVGDWVAFQVSDVAFQVGDDVRDFVRPGSCAVWLPKKHVTKIPPPDPHAVLKEAVVRAAISLVKNAATFGYDLPSCKKDVVDAVSALLAAQRPPSKYDALRKAVEKLFNSPQQDFTRLIMAVSEKLSELEAEERG